MKYFKYIYSLAVVSLLFASCKEEVLDRSPLTEYIDEEFWRNENDLRLYGNSFYTNYFVGYNSSFTADYTPVRGYTFSDDLTSKNTQAAFESSVPTSRGSASEAAAWMSSYAGPTWNFAWVRKSNIFIDRVETVAKPNISQDAYKHWSAVGRFFRGFEYSRLVRVFGDVPYFDHELLDNEKAELFKDRDNRGLVMDKVYDDFKYVLTNMRESDGTNNLNRYIAAGFISRFMLFEGTYQHYHGLDAARAKKYLELAVEAGDLVMNSGKYNFSRDFKSLFTSESLVGHPEVLMYRVYDAALTVTHSIASYSNGTETVGVDPNLALVKSFIVNDGKVWQNSGVANATSFSIANLAKTRDPRFEASFMDVPTDASATLLYGYKFAPREALTFIGKTYPPAWGSNTNTSDAPIMRLAEVVLNWIEAKAVLAQYMGGAAVSQADLDKSVNAIRNRPLEAAAIAKGVMKTAPLMLGSLPNDPARDADVPALIWEIRRERRMEFVFEYSRLLDLKRWKKLNYMDFSTNTDALLGPWVDVKNEIPIFLTAANANAKNIKVKKLDGTVVTYNGTNADAMVGFWVVINGNNRNVFTDRSYLSPIGQTQIVDYQEKGYKLTQTTGW
ncbi:RagB/SusD family nutrient uptake outer membrane protein [Pedobacter insulae]|uniref:SusD family protein n=1 Tax=Pedobacter insulae TaxID=414048 RepID=A0A1I2T685_9SPHI|nr:RagB/SusD family nutrient uptake outer membrane protein [Pedobacter insulae]SFG57781.1 SusD family protein [Pedobacter insulae]